ncbi:MAG: hypothetical protein QNJ16_22090, partial [Rhodobacter sp.]|nr:hypothetical protein [Rhodobacter sp.]
MSIATYGHVAHGGDCTGSLGVFVCAGPADPATDTTQAISVSGTGLTVTTAGDFGLDTTVTGGDGFDLSASGGGALSFLHTSEGAISAAGTGVTTVATGSVSTTIVTNLVSGATGDGVDAGYQVGDDGRRHRACRDCRNPGARSRNRAFGGVEERQRA